MIEKVQEICKFGDFLGSISKRPSHLRVIERVNIPFDRIDPRTGVIVPSTYCQRILATKERVKKDVLCYIIIDKDGKIQKDDLNVVLKQMTKGEISKMERKCDAVKVGGGSSLGYCTVIPSLDPKVAFQEMRDKNLNWNDILTFWMTENCGCDMRIIDLFKNILIPLYPLDGHYVETVQMFNPHAILFTNSGIGKTYLCETTNIPCGINETEAGLFGGPISSGNLTWNTSGQLAGIGGGLVFDEVIEEQNPIFLMVLNYAEQGKARRLLKVPITCEGTKTLVFSSNLKSTQECAIAAHFKEALKRFATENAPERVGRRIGVVLVGNSYKVVDQSTKVIGYRDIFKRLLDSSLMIYEPIIRKIELNVLKKRKWQEEKPEWYIRELEEQYALCDRSVEEGQIIQDFIKGMLLGYSKVKVAALRLYILQNLDKIVLDRDRMSLFSDKRLDEFFDVCSIPHSNIESLNRLIDTVGPSKLLFVDFRKEFLGDLREDKVKYNRQYAEAYAKSERHIRRWKRAVKDSIKT